MNFDELKAERIRLIDATKKFWDDQDAKGGEECTLAEKEQITALNKELEQVEGQLSESKQLQDLRASHTAKSAELDKPRYPAPLPGGNGNGGERREVKTIGEQFAEFKDFLDWRGVISPGGRIADGVRVGDSPAMPFNAKTLITGTSATSAGAMVQRDYAGLQDPGFRPLTLRDIITIGRTTSDLIEYPRVTGYTNNAAATAEATATGDGTGAKPESAMALEKVTTSVKTIAHWIPATKRALSDAGQIETLINAFLDQGLEETLETEMISGDGTGEHFDGIDHIAGTTAQAWDTNLLTTTRKARTKVRVTGRAQATAYLLHPDDWERIDLLQDNEARYFFGGPAILGSPRIWGLPVVESEAVPTGKGWCADFRQMVLWDREMASIRVSDSHSDFFVRNLVAILAELRAAFGVFRPAAIVEMDLTA